MYANITNDTLFLNNKPIIKGIKDGFSIAPINSDCGAFLYVDFPNKDGVIGLQNLGTFVGAKAFGGSHMRPDTPYWFSPFGSTTGFDIKNQIVWMGVAHEDGSYSFIATLPTEDTCIFINPKQIPESERKDAEPSFNFFGETGDGYTMVSSGVGAFIINGTNFPEIVEQAANEINRYMANAELRKNKQYPEFAKKLGWCTWNAFYQEVSAEKVFEGLKTLKAVGIEPRTLILDDGWQQVGPLETGGTVLTGWDGNEKFGSMKDFVAKVKENSSIDTFMVWHAVCGYWYGVAKELFPDSSLSQRMPLRYCDNSVCDWQRGFLNLNPNDFESFFDAYHSHLAECGIDGVKVDNQACLSFQSSGVGGRVKRFNQMRTAVNRTTKKYFNNNLITCMAHAPEIFFNSKENNITRASDDYFPNSPESHPLHLYTNAMTATWYGHFLWMDWDMFLTEHATGKYHAAARAVSGGPIYFADEPGKHDATLINRTVYADGTTPRSAAPARVMTRSVFKNLNEGHSPLELVTPFKYGTMCSFFSMVISSKENHPSASICDFDIAAVEELTNTGKTYACWSETRQELTKLKQGDTLAITLPALEFELLTLSPIENGFAPIGFVNMFNTLGAVEECEYQSSGAIRMKLHGNGSFVAYSATKPTKILVNGETCEFSWDSEKLCFDVSSDSEVIIQF